MEDSPVNLKRFNHFEIFMNFLSGFGENYNTREKFSQTDCGSVSDSPDSCEFCDFPEYFPRHFNFP